MTGMRFRLADEKSRHAGSYGTLKPVWAETRVIGTPEATHIRYRVRR